ncbi:hypothetical protein JVU11DRAFT_8574 [Chiua virens]|nr:hypothetical protein JVU11DRAFT_8574 [Chiua virens]
MYASANAYRAPGRPRHHRSRTQSDPGHSYVDPPYTIPWPAPARQAPEPMGTAAGMPYQQSPSRSSSIERIPGDPFLPSPGSLLASQMSNSPSVTNTSTPVSPRSPSPQRPGHQRSSSRQGRAAHGPLIKDVPQPPRTAFNRDVPPATATPHPYQATWGQGQGLGVPIPSQSPPTSTSQSAGMQRQGSYHNVYQQPHAGGYQNTSVTHLSHHHSGLHHPNAHHPTHNRSRSRPPSAASHRYATSITQPMYGHGSSATLNASHTSLNGGVPSQRNHHASSPPPGISASHHPGTGSAHVPSGAPQRSRSHTRASASPAHRRQLGRRIWVTSCMNPHPLIFLRPPPSPPLAANEIRRTTHRLTLARKL